MGVALSCDGYHLVISSHSVGSKMPLTSGIQNKMKEVQANCKVLISHIDSIRTLTSDSAGIDPEVIQLGGGGGGGGGGAGHENG